MAMTDKQARQVATDHMAIWQPEAEPQRKRALWQWGSGVVMGAALAGAIISVGAMLAIQQVQAVAQAEADASALAALSQCAAAGGRNAH